MLKIVAEAQQFGELAFKLHGLVAHHAEALDRGLQALLHGSDADKGAHHPGNASTGLFGESTCPPRILPDHGQVAIALLRQGGKLPLGLQALTIGEHFAARHAQQLPPLLAKPLIDLKTAKLDLGQLVAGSRLIFEHAPAGLRAARRRTRSRTRVRRSWRICLSSFSKERRD